MNTAKLISDIEKRRAVMDAQFDALNGSSSTTPLDFSAAKNASGLFEALISQNLHSVTAAINAMNRAESIAWNSLVPPFQSQPTEVESQVIDAEVIEVKPDK